MYKTARFPLDFERQPSLQELVEFCQKNLPEVPFDKIVMYTDLGGLVLYDRRQKTYSVSVASSKS